MQRKEINADPVFVGQQSLDSSCDILGLKERIQKSQEERERREEHLLQSQSLQLTGLFPINEQWLTRRETREMTAGRPVASASTTSPPRSTCLFLDMEEEEETVCFADPTRFITDPDFCYQEFARREEDHFQVFRVQVGLVYLTNSVFLKSDFMAC